MDLMVFIRKKLLTWKCWGFSDIFLSRNLLEAATRGVWWPSTAIVNSQFENNILFEKRYLNLLQNFKTK